MALFVIHGVCGLCINRACLMEGPQPQTFCRKYKEYFTDSVVSPACDCCSSLFHVELLVCMMFMAMRASVRRLSRS